MEGKVLVTKSYTCQQILYLCYYNELYFRKSVNFKHDYRLANCLVELVNYLVN